MELVIVILIGCAVFAACFATMMLRGRNADAPPKLHACGQPKDCHCQQKGGAREPFDLKNGLDKPANDERQR